MADHDVLPHGGDGGQDGRLGADDDPGRGRREGLPSEESRPLVLGERVGVEVVAGAGEAGHGVARGGAHAPLCQMKSETFIFQRNSQKNSSLTDLNCSK